MFNSSEFHDSGLPLSMPFNCSVISSNTSLPVGTKEKTYYAEFFFLRKGSISFSLDNHSFTLFPGEVLSLFPGAERSLSAAADQAFECVWIQVDPDQMTDFPCYTPGLKTILLDAAKQRMPIRLTSAQAESIGLVPLLESAVSEQAGQDYGWGLAAQSWLYLAYSALIRFWQKRGLVISPVPASEDPILSITAYINQHVQDGLRVEDLAARCALSYPWFAKKFREIYGVSCKEYIEQVRISRVAEYLRYTNWDLTEISKATGYADCSHMIKNFKRLRGTTPGQYRAGLNL